LTNVIFPEARSVDKPTPAVTVLTPVLTNEITLSVTDVEIPPPVPVNVRVSTPTVTVSVPLLPAIDKTELKVVFAAEVILPCASTMIATPLVVPPYEPEVTLVLAKLTVTFG